VSAAKLAYAHTRHACLDTCALAATAHTLHTHCQAFEAELQARKARAEEGYEARKAARAPGQDWPNKPRILSESLEC
jgi:hypothetical protein